ncbi:MAG: GntR family transcriptional regulator [Hyphomicrobiales bacterium]|nr:GntR family transcriptional regulator [Hyphomicrobiales bacterium]
MTIAKLQPATEPLPRETLGDRIYVDLVNQLRHGIIDGAARLVDVDLARAYGTSRMPVREALMRLASEGYLISTTRGFTLPRLSDDDIREIFDVRRLLEPAAAASAAVRIGKAGEKTLTAALKQARAAAMREDLQKMIEANIAFRNGWLAVVPNRRLAETIARFSDQVHAVRLNTLSDPAIRRVVVDLLTKLHRAFLDRDAPVVDVQTRAFIDAAEQAYFRNGGIAAVPLAVLPRARAEGRR